MKNETGSYIQYLGNIEHKTPENATLNNVGAKQKKTNHTTQKSRRCQQNLTLEMKKPKDEVET